MLLVDSIIIKEPVDKTQQSWLELMIVMKDCNDRLFSSKDQTTKLVENDTYISQIHQIQPLLHSWLKRFNALDRKSYSQFDTADLTNKLKSHCTRGSSFRLSITTLVDICTPTVIDAD